MNEKTYQVLNTILMNEYSSSERRIYFETTSTPMCLLKLFVQLHSRKQFTGKAGGWCTNKTRPIRYIERSNAEEQVQFISTRRIDQISHIPIRDIESSTFGCIRSFDTIRPTLRSTLKIYSRIGPTRFFRLQLNVFRSSGRSVGP